MKFTDGFWLLKPEYTALYPTQVHEFAVKEGSLLAYLPYRRIEKRNAQISTGMMTVTVTPYIDGVIRIHLQNHAGACKRPPQFELVCRMLPAIRSFWDKSALLCAAGHFRPRCSETRGISLFPVMALPLRHGHV